MEKWREDAQPEGPEVASATAGTREDDENPGRGDTQDRAAGRNPAGAGAGGGTGARTLADTAAIEARWARIGVFAGNDRTQVMDGASGHGERPARPEARTDGTRVLPQPGPGLTAARTDRGTAPRRDLGTGDAGTGGRGSGREGTDRSAVSRGDAGDRTGAADAGRAGGGRDPGRVASARAARTGAPAGDDRTALLRIPSPPGPGAGAAWPAARPGGAWPPGDVATAGSARTGAPPAPAQVRTPVRDPWRTGADEPVAVTHDPHEVTVQLDAVQFGDGVLRRAPAAPGRAGGGQDASDGPVFVDESGRRGRRYRRIGMAAGVACAGYAVVIVATLLSGNSNAPWLPVPGQQKDRPAGQVDTSPQPAGTESVPGSGTSLLPGGTPTAGDTTPPSPGAEAPAPGATGRPDEPGTTTGPAPTPTRSTREPGTGADAPTPTPPAETPTTPAPDPTPTDDPAPETTAPTGGDDAGDVTGTDNRAGAPAGPPVVAGSPAARPEPSATPATAPSPEYVL